jgi:hypothetical protein
MTKADGERQVRNAFEQARARFHPFVSTLLTEGVEEVIEEATAIFEEMIPDMAYLDRPDNVMAASLFVCNINLAFYVAMRERGVDVHDFGRTMLEGLANSPPQPQQAQEQQGTPMQRFAKLIALGESSQTDAAAGEFVFEAYVGDRGETDWGMNVTSCAICAAFSKYDAMDLVPYMCATDDVISDKGNQGLRRSGSIAVGAHQCDFRYKTGGEPQRLAAQYPDRIRVTQSGT